MVHHCSLSATSTAQEKQNKDVFNVWTRKIERPSLDSTVLEVLLVNTRWGGGGLGWKYSKIRV